MKDLTQEQLEIEFQMMKYGFCIFKRGGGIIDGKQFFIESKKPETQKIMDLIERYTESKHDTNKDLSIDNTK